MIPAIHFEHEHQQVQIKHLVLSRVEAGIDPFDRMADFTLPSEADLYREKVSRLESALSKAMQHLCPVKKATKKVLEQQIEMALAEIRRVVEV